MAAPMEDVSEDRETRFCTVEATVVTGFESVAVEEAAERFNTKCKQMRGRISIECPIEKVEQVTDLGCVDNCRVVIKHVSDFRFTDDQTENLQRLRNLVGSVDWPAGLKIWRKFFSFEHGVADYPPIITTDFGEVIIPPPRQTSTAGKKSKHSKKKNKWPKKHDRKKEGTGHDLAKNFNETGHELANNSGGVSSQTEGAAINMNHTVEGNESGDTEKRASNESIHHVVKDDPSSNGSETQMAVGDSSATRLDCENHVAETTVAVDDNTISKVDSGKRDTLKDNQDISIENVTKKPRVRENPWNPMMPSFRVTCIRVGNHHNFDSMSAASNFGGAIYRYSGWNVKMTEFDIEVILGIDDQEVTVSIGLTKESLHRRNITHFGPTTLRPTIAYCMLRLCEVKKGDVVCDPMCGSGSISIQGALHWPYSHNIAGDIGKRALERCHGNLSDMEKERKKENKSALLMDAIRWDVTKLPMREQSLDVFITDLPFGIRMGRKVQNWKLYPGALFEMARVVRPESGRCCLLTEDKKCMIKTLQHAGKYWKRTKTFGVNLGGLAAGVFVLMRTAQKYDIKSDDRDMFAQKGKKVNKSASTGSASSSGDEA